eukprot:sb/3475569/
MFPDLEKEVIKTVLESKRDNGYIGWGKYCLRQCDQITRPFSLLQTLSGQCSDSANSCNLQNNCMAAPYPLTYSLSVSSHTGPKARCELTRARRASSDPDLPGADLPWPRFTPFPPSIPVNRGPIV